jgi:hypothetical protein
MPAAAQSPQRDDPVSVNDMRRVADDLGACVTGAYGDTSRRIVLEPISHSDVFRRFWVEFSGRCLNENDPSGIPVQMRFPYPTVHAILADNLVRRDYRSVGPADLSGAPALDPIPAPQLLPLDQAQNLSERDRAELAAEHASQGAWMTLQRIGMCTARRSPEVVRNTLLTRVGSDEERAGLRGLAAQIGGCVPTGSTVRLRPAELRWVLALGYYRLANASIGTVPTAVGTR